jgi:hypothetical protein
VPAVPRVARSEIGKLPVPAVIPTARHSGCCVEYAPVARTEERSIKRRESVTFSEQTQSSGWPPSGVSIADAFESLYRQHLQAVYRFALRCVSRADPAEDLTAEAFLALYRNLDQIETSRLPFRHWRDPLRPEDPCNR